ncbi:uncharacterized protein LOC121808761 [Salvia splendens]|uniref:uncharacterized protein LOC121808761 n=1 Tax=Salvia splendens TaxID=180675 RepID=UPI001C27B974|nr:uncharacterized protein LOC121808761 [Salvia splendens]
MYSMFVNIVVMRMSFGMQSACAMRYIIKPNQHYCPQFFLLFSNIPQFTLTLEIYNFLSFLPPSSRSKTPTEFYANRFAHYGRIWPIGIQLVEDSQIGERAGRRPKTDRTRRSWSTREEEALMLALKDLVVNKWESDNEFRGGYLARIEEIIKRECPKSDIKATSHISSKL